MALFICQRCEAQSDTWNGACASCGGTEQLKVAQQVDRMLGRIIAGRYKILRRLGQGGMGSVYLAEQVGIGQQVAMKFLNSGLSLDPDVARRFLNEAKSYARVAHPNAVTLHDFGQDEEGSLYISMEYVEGDDLKRLLSNVGRLELHEAADIMLQVADVLAYAHARQVVHRDLKPENIMVRRGMRGWHVKVLDFGIARVADGATRLTAQGAVAGTPRYMSPEQAMGLDADARADIYAVGLVLFELITGKQPFDGSSVAEIMQKQVHQPVPHLRDVVPELQYPAVDTVIQKATAKKRVERYETMEAFASDLSNALPTLTGRSPISGVTPTVKGTTPIPGEHGTLLFGDGSEATLVRGKAVTGTADAGRYNTGRVPLVEPIQLTEPKKDGFNKTAHATSPYVEPKRSRTGLVMGLGMAAVLLAGGVGVVAIRSQGGAGEPQVAVAAEPPVAPAPPAPSPVEAPVAETPAPTVPAAPSAVADPSTPTVPTAPQVPEQPAGSVAEAAVDSRQVEQAEERLIEIGDDFEDGDLDKALKKMERARSLGLDAVSPKLADLGRQLDDVAKRLAQAHKQRELGECDKAIRLYEALLNDHSQLGAAWNGIKRCKAERLPETME